MAFTVVLSEAAVRYGLRDISANGDFSVLGTAVGITNSWGAGPPPVGQSGVITVSFNTGFRSEIAVSGNSPTSATVSRLQVFTPQNDVLYAYTGQLAVDSSNVLAQLNDTILLAGSDTVLGNSDPNVLQAYAGNDYIEGGAGIDTAVFSGSRSQYVTQLSGEVRIVGGPDGTDTLVGVERLRFDDGTLAFDASTGQAYRLYQAAFDRAPDPGGLGFHVNRLDNGLSLQQIAQNFLDSPEFQQTYGGLDNTRFVQQLYLNVLGRPGEAAGVAYHVNDLSMGVGRATLLSNFSESPENQAALVGVLSQGVAFTAV